jgi:hypothetical protein
MKQAVIFLMLGIYILLRVLDQVQEFPSNATVFKTIVYYFIQIIRYMFRSYDLKMVVRPNLNKIINNY